MRQSNSSEITSKSYERVLDFIVSSGLYLFEELRIYPTGNELQRGYQGAFMKDVLVFFNSQPVEVIRTLKAVNTIRRQYPDGRERHLRIKLTGLHSVSQKHTEIYIASDREVLHEEVIQAARQYL